MEATQYKYEARVSVDAWWIKLYAWAWRADKYNADFCKLAWGYIGMLPNLMFRAIFLPFWLAWKGLRIVAKVVWALLKRIAAIIGPGIDFLWDRFLLMMSRRQEPTEIDAPPPTRARKFAVYHRSVKPPRRPWRSILPRVPKFNGDAVLTKVSETASRTITAGQEVKYHLRWLRWPLRILFYASLVAVALAVALVVGWALYQFFALSPLLIHGAWIGLRAAGIAISVAALWLVGGIWWLLPFLGLAVGGIIVCLLLFYGLITVHDETEVFQTVGRTAVKGTSSFWGAMRTGVWGIKRNTCPKIVMVKDSAQNIHKR